MKRSIALLMGGVLCLPSLSIYAQEADKAPWEEYDKLIKSREAVAALSSELLGDSVDLSSGALSFTATDVSIPGNNALPVAFSRKFTVSNRKGYTGNDASMADWEIDTPRLSGVFASAWPDQRCTIVAPPPAVYRGDRWFQADEYWHGNSASMPGGGQMLKIGANTQKPTSGGPYYWMTSGQTFFSCLPSIQNSTGEGFLAITSDGTKYRFDWMAQYQEPQLKGKTANGSPIYVGRRKNVLYATHVEDRFGNWVAYTYTNGANSAARLTTINSSDGRQLVIGYNGNGHVASVNDGARNWTYQYSYPTSITGTLTGVILPDTSRWTLNLGALASAKFHYHKSNEPGDPYRSCFDPGMVMETTPVAGTITHPSGATGEFTVAPVRQGRTNVPALCGNYSLPSNDPNDDVAFYPINWDSFSLTQKRLTGPALAPATWTYSYGGSNSWFYPPSGNGLPVCGDPQGCAQPACTSDSCAGTTKTTVVGPSSWTRYTFGNSYRYNEGKLLKVEQGSSATDVLKTTVTAYNWAQSGQPFPTPIGSALQWRGDGFTSEYLRPEVSTTISQQGADFSSVVNSFDGFARPLGVTKSSTLGAPSRTDVTAYHDDLSKWVLGQVSLVVTTSVSPNAVLSQTTYDPATALPIFKYGPGTTATPGKLMQAITYNGDGTIATVSDGRDGAGGLDTTTVLSGWKRGIPQSIKHPPTPEAPAGATESAVVNNDGTLASVTDENGYKTCYGYDVMGRLSSITYPSESHVGICDTSTWNRSTREFIKIDYDEHGIPAGHWRSSQGTGTGYRNVYYDGLWRPVLEESLDTNNINDTLSQVVRHYDASGRLSFQSYPIRGVDKYWEVTQGTRTYYDALDRVTRVEQDSELGVLHSSTDYLSGFQTRATNPRGKQTTTGYFGYGQPSYGQPAWIQQPAGVRTDITRDIFGKPLEVKRSGPDS